MRYQDLIEFKRKLELSGDFLCELMQLDAKRFRRQRLPRKTMVDAKPEAQDVDLSPKALAVAAACDALYARAIEVHGERDKALDWLYQDMEQLGGKAPIDLISEAGGMGKLQSLLGAGTPAPRSAPVPAKVEEAAVAYAASAARVAPAVMEPVAKTRATIEKTKKYRIDGYLKKLLATHPELTKAGLARSMQELGFTKFDAARASRLSLGYADATGDEVEGFARILKVDPGELIGA